MTEYRKHAVYEPGTVCFYEDKDDSWRIGSIDAIDGDVVTISSCTSDGQPDGACKTSRVAQDKLAPLENEWLQPVRDLLEMTTLQDALLLEQVVAW